MAATGLLARGWFRGRLGGWLGTSAVLAGTLTLLILVSSLFAGMQSETEGRVGDIFTGDLRVTPVEVGVFGSGEFEDADAAIDALGTDATMRMESQAILSRRSFTSILLQGEDTPTVQAPGAKGDVSLGVLVGADFSDPIVAKPYQRHMIVGSLPGAWNGQGDIPLAVSLRTLEGFLSEEEIRLLREEARSEGRPEWPPAPDAIRRLPLDLTAGVARDGDYRNDVYRNGARIVGVYTTGVETLDAFTFLGPIEAARYLLGDDLDEGNANVLIVNGDPGKAQTNAEAAGYATEGKGDFTERYLGQLITALQVLSQMTAAILFTVPAFLVAHGVERVLEAHRREVAVLQAIGVPNRTFRSALGRLIALTTALAFVGAALLAALLLVILHGALPTWDASPVPLDVRVTTGTILGALFVGIASVVVAFAIAVRGQSRSDLPSELRVA